MDNRCKSLAGSFKPAWWLRNPHLQTLWASVLRRAPRPALRRERLELPDGDFLDLDWTAGTSGPIVILLHGLQGSSNSKYVRGLLQALHRRGWRAVLMHFRGCSGESNRLARFYHAGDTADFNTLVTLLRAREPATPLAAIGCSLGGNVLLKWLGELASQAPLVCAVAVSVPFDLARSVDHINRGWSRIYQYWLTRCLRIAARRKFSRLPSPLGAINLGQLRTLRAYDSAVTAPLHGFASVEAYYTQSSCHPYLKHIRTPTLLTQAQDDPFLPATALPTLDALSTSIRLELQRHGGHIGFISGNLPWALNYWLEQRIPDYIAAALATTAADNHKRTTAGV
jgi:predicted alpha/beta-fold hydrolase